MRSETDGRTRVLGVVLLAVTVGMVAVTVALFLWVGDISRVVWGLPGASGLWALGFSGAGYPITRRHPANPVGWCLLTAGVASGVAVLGTAIPFAGNPDGPALLLMNFWVVSVAALCTTMVLFPSGSPPSRWWWGFLAVVWGSGCLEYFKATPTSPEFAFLPERLDVLAAPTNFVFQLCLGVQFLALLARWRSSGPVERLQLKWVVYTVTLVASLALVVEVGLANLVPALYLPGTFALSLAVVFIPLSMGIAMLRYQLYDIDLVVNRTLVYTVLTASLGLVYIGAVVGLQYVFRTFAGGGSQLAVVASTLLIAALFSPLRQRIQLLIDRRFYRRKYDARRTLETFSSRLRDGTDLEQLSSELLAVVGDTMQPEHASLWLRDRTGKAQQETRS